MNIIEKHNILSQSRLFEKMRAMGFNPDDIPYLPFKNEWESLPIIKALRKCEALTAIKYTRNAPLGSDNRT